MAQLLFGSLWSTLATILLCIAVVALAASVYPGRARGRRRCPKCWYDMRGVEGLRCPECGRQARCEHELFRTRRRLRSGIVAAAALVMMSYVVGNWPRIQDRGLLGLAPTTLIVGAVPWLIDDVGPDLLQPGTAAARPGDRLFVELHHRIRNGDLWKLHWHVLVRHCMSHGPARLLAQQRSGTIHRYRQLLLIAEQGGVLLRIGVQGQVADLVHVEWRTQPKYLRGSPVYAFPYVMRWEGNTELELHAAPICDNASRVLAFISSDRSTLRDLPSLYTLGVAGSPASLRHRIHVYRVASDALSTRTRRPQAVLDSVVAFEVVDDLDEVLAPVRSDDFDQKLAASLQPCLVVTSEKAGAAKLVMTSPHRIMGLAGIDTVYGTIEVLRDDVVLARTYAAWAKHSASVRILSPHSDDTVLYVASPDTDPLSWASVDGARMHMGRAWYMSQPIHGDQALWSVNELRSGTWRLRLVHEPALAVNTFSALSRWVGEVECPLNVDVRFGGEP